MFNKIYYYKYIIIKFDRFLSNNIERLSAYCSHSRAHQYMTESIGSTSGFKARTCESWEKYKEGHCDYNPIVLMGEYASTS